jgi:XTP/dITP diphosphohydrolase
MTPYVLASNNPGKVREIEALLQSIRLPIHLQPQSDFDVPPVEENGSSFIENALIKARHACLHTGQACIADDSGLCVPALGMEPGIRSARYGGEDLPPAGKMALLQKNIDAAGLTRPSAFFYCAAVCIQTHDDPTPLVATGIWHGIIIRAPQGSHGFGYDPIFFLPEYAATAAQLQPEQKQHISHRAIAFKALWAQWIQAKRLD